MEIGNEISQKIRSAIKAKLVELGAYVDDELPDYIMVMVANKKSKAHMTEDLNLFLGNNTDRFTTWLHGLLQKLKSITVEQSKGISETSEEITQHDGTPAQESGEVIDPEGQAQDTVVTEAPKLTEQQRKKIEEEEEVERALEAIEEDELTLQPDTDEFAEEEKMATGTKQNIPSGKSASSASKVKPRIVASQAKEAIAKALSESSRSRTSSRSTTKDTLKVTSTSPKETSSKSSKTSPRTVTRSSSNTTTDGASSSRKRKAPGSVIGLIIKRDEEEEDEEYDPHKPHYGRVASTVKVGQRRPSVPPSKQANKSLLMKAVSEAKTSIEKTTKKGVVEPTLRTDSRSSVHSRLGSSVSDARSRLGPHRSSTRRRSSPERLTSSRSRMRSDEIEVKRSLSSRSKRQESKERLSSDVKVKRTRSEPEDLKGRAEDSRVFESKSDGESEAGDEEVESRTIQNEQERSGSPQLELLIQSGAEDSDFTDVEAQEEIENAEGSKRVVQEPVSEGREKAASPKFVVSLDGIDPEMIEKFEGRMDEDMEGEEEIEDIIEDEELTREEEMDAEEAAMRARNIVRVRPMQITMGDQPDVAAKRPKLAEKCKFWPACRSGNECQYHHPTTPCKAFPNCSFGEKCNYIHPSCMFDANCTRPNCPYTHASKKKMPATSPPIIIQPIKMVPISSPPVFPSGPPPVQTNKSGKIACKFFPKCTNMNCPFYHPKPCRFGLSCRNRLTGCPFAHPSLPSKDQLKWTASNRPVAASEPDDSLETVVIEQTDIGNQSDEEDESVNINL